MSYQSTSYMFRSLTDEEEAEFRASARATDPPDLAKWDLYHPVCREEWEARGIHPCPWTATDECRMARERSVAGISDSIPACATHGPYSEEKDADNA